MKYQLFNPWLPRIPFSYLSIVYHLPIDVSEIVAIILSHVKIFKIAAKVFQAFQTFLFYVIYCGLDAGSTINTVVMDQSFLLYVVLIGKLPDPFSACCILVLSALLQCLIKNGAEAQRLDQDQWLHTQARISCTTSLSDFTRRLPYYLEHLISG